MFNASDYESDKIGGTIEKLIARLKNKRGMELDLEETQKSDSVSPEREKKLEFIKSQIINSPIDSITGKEMIGKNRNLHTSGETRAKVGTGQRKNRRNIMNMSIPNNIVNTTFTGKMTVQRHLLSGTSKDQNPNNTIDVNSSVNDTLLSSRGLYMGANKLVLNE